MRGVEAEVGHDQAPCSYGRRPTPLKPKNPLPRRSHAWGKCELNAPPNKTRRKEHDPPRTELNPVPDAAAAVFQIPCLFTMSPRKSDPAPANPFGPSGASLESQLFEEATKVREGSTKTESNSRERSNDDEDVELEEDRYEERANANGSVSTPPKNALLLTRCRSAPYRSSSLASRFWGSPLRSEEAEEEQGTKLENGEPTENEKHSSQRESVSDKEGRIDPKTEEKFGIFKELEDSIEVRIIKSENIQELKRMEEGGDSVRPLILTRCKSEPARTTQKLDPEFNF